MMRAHDLLRLSPAACERLACGAPAWVGASLSQAPWVVVRRERTSQGIAIGVRGAQRSERYAAIAEAHDVELVMTPESLAHVRAPRRHPVFDALTIAVAAAQACGLACGPAGAAAFELASGRAVLHARSDLDLIVRAHPGDPRVLPFAAACSHLRVRLDAELSFGDDCAAALAETLAARRWLVKTPDGPRLLEVAHA